MKRYTALSLLLAPVLFAAVATGDDLPPNMVDTPGQILVDSKDCWYQLLDSGKNCTNEFVNTLCCLDGRTASCVLLPLNTPCPLTRPTPFCAWCPGEAKPSKGPFIETRRLIDTTGQRFMRDKCRYVGNGPDEQCGDSRDRSEIKCCTDTSATNCVPASDSGYCPIDYPASYCIVCDADKWKPSEVASLALGVVGAVCGVAGSVLAVVQFSLQRRKEKKEATAAAAKAAVAAAAAAPLQIKVTVPHADVAEP